jgi:hypothetical protein
VKITIELEWDPAAQTFVGSWNKKLLALPPGALPDSTGSAFDAVAEYKPGGIRIISLERATQHPRAVLAAGLLHNDKPAEAVAALSGLAREVLSRDPEVQALRACAHAAAGDGTSALADLDAVLAAAALTRVTGHRIHDVLKVLPGPEVRARMRRICEHLPVMDPPLVGVRDLPDDAWTKDLILEVLRTHAAATMGYPHIVEELVAQARRIGAAPVEIDTALGKVSRQVDDARRLIAQREQLAREHVDSCLAASKTSDAMARMIALLRNPGPGLIAAIELDHSYDSEDELVELRRTLQIELAPPAPASSLAGLPDELAALFALTNGVRLSWSGEQLLAAARVKSLARELGIADAFPFADDDQGSQVALRLGRVIAIERGQVSDDLTDSFSVWLCAYVAAGLNSAGAAVTLGEWQGRY